MADLNDLQNLPYAVGSVVYFVSEHGIKRGEVVAIVCHVSAKGITREWHIAEPQKGADFARNVYHVDLNGIAYALENMAEKAQAKNWAFREMQRREDELVKKELENNKRN